MKVIMAILMGFLSGFLIYMMVAVTFITSVANPSSPSGWLVFVVFVGGWVLSSYAMLHGARTLSKVFCRGFLIGAAEWLAVIPVGMIFAGQTVSKTVASSGGSDAAAAGAAIGGGIFTFLTGGVSIFMAIVCLTGFAVSYFMGREMKPEASAPTKKCPECAELVQAEARKCRYCGADLLPTKATT